MPEKIEGVGSQPKLSLKQSWTTGNWNLLKPKKIINKKKF